MFLTWVTDSTQAIQHIFAAVSSDMEPCTLFDGDILVDTPETQHLFTSQLFEVKALTTHTAFSFLQFSQILGDKSVGNLLISVIDISEELALTLEDML